MGKPITVDGETVIVPDNATPEQMLQMAKMHSASKVSDTKQPVNQPAPTATLEQGGTSPDEFVAGKIAPYMPGGDSFSQYQRAKKLAPFTGLLPIVGAAEPAYQTAKSFSEIGPELSRGEYGEAAKSVGGTALNAAGTILGLAPGAMVAKKLAGPVIAKALENAGRLTGEAQTLLTPAIQKTAEVIFPKSMGKKYVKSIGSEALSAKDLTARKKLADAIAEHQKLTSGLTEAGNVPATPSSIGIGEQKNLSDIAGSAQQNIFATQQAEKEAMEAAREHLQGLEQEAVNTNEAAGKPFEKTAGVQEILKKAAPFKNFDPATAPTLLPTSDKQTRSLYRLVHDALADKEFSYTDPVTGEDVTKTFNNSFSAASDLRRFLGQAFNKETGGYGAIKKSIQEDLYGLLNKAENEYTAGKSQAWKDNYSASKKLAERFDENPRVARVVKTYGTEGKPVMTPAQFSDVLTSGDRTQINDLFEATADKLKPQLRQSIADAIETKFRGANYDTFAKEMAPGGKLSDQLKHEELSSFKPQIENYMTKLKDAENADVAIQNISLKIPKAKEAINTAKTNVANVEIDTKDFSQLSPDKALDAAYSHISDLRKAGQMTKAEYEDVYDQLSKSKRLLGITPTMRTKVISIIKKTGKVALKSAIPAAGIGGAGYYLGNRNESYTNR
jgi:hypothetical protein